MERFTMLIPPHADKDVRRTAMSPSRVSPMPNGALPQTG
jgi:hypothetical protein